MELEIASIDPKYEELRVEDRTKLGRLTASLLEYVQKTPVLMVGSEGEERLVLLHLEARGHQRVPALPAERADALVAADQCVPLQLRLTINQYERASARPAMDDGVVSFIERARETPSAHEMRCALTVAAARRRREMEDEPLRLAQAPAREPLAPAIAFIGPAPAASTSMRVHRELYRDFDRRRRP